MKILGLDIGTTTVSAVVVENGQVIASRTLDNGAFLPTLNSWEKIQDVAAIRATALSSVEAFFDRFPDIGAIGVTGQMHGIVYLDAQGQPLSPLYIWQDGRGDLPYDPLHTYAGHLTAVTGYPVSTGYGMATHFYNLKNSLVPENAAVFCTIHDYIAMILANRTSPLMDASDAASYGLFDVEAGHFDLDALKKAGIPADLLPILAQEKRIGFYREDVPVFVAIGDNQASFLGAANGDTGCILANVGTGSQFSAYTPHYIACPGLETRPFPGGGFLLVGASLCGGRAYALLEEFLRATAEAMTGSSQSSVYDAMKNLLDSADAPGDLPRVVPLFQGTRQDPSLRGSITGISTENFTPRHLIWATMEGMARELRDLYQLYLAAGGKPARLIGSGNGLRKNIHLQDCFSRQFGQPLTMSQCSEEAAAGAALFAAKNL